MGLIPDQLRRELRGPTIGSKRRAQIVGVSSYLLGAFVFIYLTWYHCEENPTQVTYMIELDVAGEPATPPPTPPCDQEAEANIVGCRPRDHNSSAANKEDFWGAVSHIMNTGRKPGESEQLVPEASLESCEFFMQPAMRVGMGKQAPTGTNLTHHFITRPIESFLVVTCVQKTTLGEAAGLSIGWFDKVVTVVVLGAAFIFELTSANSQPIEIGDSGEILPGKPQEEKQPLAEGGSGNQVHPVDATDS